MWCTIRYIRKISKYGNSPRKFKRLFMSSSFPCQEVWASRLKAPILQRVNIENLFHELDSNYGQERRVSAIDIDIFVNALKNGEHLDEAEELVHKLRLSRESSNALESTSHAFIRTYLEFGKADELMRILNDRLNYGVFPDKYCSILLMDTFIKKGDFCNAAKVATLQMLQEDFTDDLIKYLSLYSCHKYLLEPTLWEKEEEPVPENDEEEIKVRVKYIRNPFFDNHFDLKDPDHLIGKTLLMIGDCTEESIGISYKLLGSILFNDKNTEEFITNILTKGAENFPHANVIDLAENVIERLTNKYKDSDNNPSLDFEKIRNGLSILKEGKKFASGNSLEILEEKIKKIIASEEKNLIKEQTQIYEDWENHRENALKIELEALKKKHILLEIEKKKEELKQKEEELFFFEKEDALDLIIENKKVEESKKTPVKTKRGIDEDYIPPEIVKQRN